MPSVLDIPLAFLAGMLTIASPCILPVIPIILGAAIERNNRTRPLFIVAGFVVSFTSFAMLLGIASSAAHLAQDALRNVAIGALAISGLLQVWPRPFEWCATRISPYVQYIVDLLPASRISMLNSSGGFLIGMSLGAVWTPCAGPVLASILILVVKAQNSGWSTVLLTLYASGAAIPMLAIIYGGQFMSRRLSAMTRQTLHLQRLFGVLIVLTALAMYLQLDVQVAAWIAGFSPT